MNAEAEIFIFPTSFAQSRLYFLHQLVPGNPFYNVSTAIRLTGSLNIPVLEQTFNEIIRRHESLRTTFLIIKGQPVQAIAPALNLSLPIINLRHLLISEREREALQLATAEAKISFNLSAEPLLRLKLLQLDETDYILLLNLHHIIADGWSIGVLLRELAVIYKAFSQNGFSPLPELPIQYADFAEWQREWLQGEVLENQLNYWRQKLDNAAILNLPTDRPRPAIPSYKGAKQVIKLSSYLREKLEALSNQENVTLFITLLAAFNTLLYRYTQQEDIVICSPIANRNRSEIEGLIGFFVNSLVLRTNLDNNPTFLELLSRVKEVALEAYAYQDLPFEKLVEELHPERDLSRNPLFQVSFSFQNTPIEALELPGLELSLLEFDNAAAKLDLEFNFWEDAEGLKLQVVYSIDLFDDNTITRMLGHFETLLLGIVSNPNQRLSDLRLLTEVEQKELLIDWNNTELQIRKLCFHQLFEEQAERTPDAIAVVLENQQLTYKQLNNRANQIAHYLQELGVVPDSLVGIYVERSLEMIIGLLGILKAGGAYLPLDPTYPQERINFILADGKVNIILTQQQFYECLNLPGVKLVLLDKTESCFTCKPQKNAPSNVTLNNLAYVIYTSGTTGKPKGVLIEHLGLANLVAAQKEVFKIQNNERILQFASFSFDAAIFEIVMALGTGATLYLAKKENLLLGQPLIKLLQEKAITHVTLPPAVLAALPKAELPALKTIISAGEVCSQDIMKKWGFNRQFFNAYGPTEATVWTTISEIKDVNFKPSIGRPIINTQVYILDKYLQPVPIGIPGVLYIAGDGLARGYLQRPELNAERFIKHPVINKRIYKTGDLARYQPDGNIEFLGRIDEQIKVRGFRIELGEITTVLRQFSGIKEAVVIPMDNSGNKRLVAYIALQEKPEITITEIRKLLKSKLPEYMIPGEFIILDALPLTPNGKVDYQSLLKLKIPSQQLKVEPRNEGERAIAQIFSQVLNREIDSIKDNFFDLGGDSLLTISLIDKINKQFGKDLPLSELFLNPTIEGLANIINNENEVLKSSPLVAIQPHGKKPPFFCVHPIFGTVFPYYQLAVSLGKEQPFYGIQPLGIDGKEAPLTSIEDMASYYIKAIKRLQAKGPYYIGGWSFGGLVALEIAQQLLTAGEEVALLAILDTQAPITNQKPSFIEGWKFLFGTVVRYIWPFFTDYFYLITATSGESRKWLWRELIIGSLLRIYQANYQATVNYIPQPYANKITLFSSNKKADDLTMGWQEIATLGVDVNLVPGNHLTMLRKPHIEVLAKQLSQYLS
jgi:amino acid adenylation domain-containing protein